MKTTFYEHWRDVPEGAWAAWPNFSPAEIACRGTGKASLRIFEVIAEVLGGILALDQAWDRSENTAASDEAWGIDKLQDQSGHTRAPAMLFWRQINGVLGPSPKIILHARFLRPCLGVGAAARAA